MSVSLRFKATALTLSRIKVRLGAEIGKNFIGDSDKQTIGNAHGTGGRSLILAMNFDRSEKQTTLV